MKEIKYLTKELLVRLNDKAILEGKNRSMRPERYEALGDDTLFPIAMSMIYNDSEIRCRVTLDSLGNWFWLDMDVEDFSNLPIKVVQSVP